MLVILENFKTVSNAVLGKCMLVMVGNDSKTEGIQYVGNGCYLVTDVLSNDWQ